MGKLGYICIGLLKPEQCWSITLNICRVPGTESPAYAPIVNKTYYQKRHYPGNPKNMSSGSDVIQKPVSTKKYFDTDMENPRPATSTGALVGTGDTSYKDVLEGCHKVKPTYRPIQAKDAINYK